MDTGSQRSVFSDGHPSKYKPRSTLLNFSERAIELALVATEGKPHPTNLIWYNFIHCSIMSCPWYVYDSLHLCTQQNATTQYRENV